MSYLFVLTVGLVAGTTLSGMFRRMMDAIMIAAGLFTLWTAFS